MEKVDYDKIKKEEMWREIPDYNGRYLISTDDRIIDREPVNLDYNSVWTYDKERTRKISITNVVRLSDGKKRKYFTYNHIKKMVFPELYEISEKEIQDIKDRINANVVSVTYDLDTFNRLVYPNKLYYLLDVTQYEGKKWKKPRKVYIDDKKLTFTLLKGHKYLGIGLFNLIHFDNYFPKNAKPYAEDPATEQRRIWVKNKRGSTKEYNMEI